MRKEVAWKKSTSLEGAKGGIYIGPTKGLSSPKNNRRGCLCLDKNTYSRKCCDGFLQQQGIGQTIYPRGYRGSFSTAFSFDFDREVND
jgi:hypothetical protein